MGAGDAVVGEVIEFCSSNLDIYGKFKAIMKFQVVL
jgi:exosome complex RNA-binding protein Rrp4